MVCRSVERPHTPRLTRYDCVLSLTAFADFPTSQETLDEVRRVEEERGAGAPAVPAVPAVPGVQGGLGAFPKTRAALETFKGTLDTF